MTRPELIKLLENAVTDWNGEKGFDHEELIHTITCGQAREIIEYLEAAEDEYLDHRFD